MTRTTILIGLMFLGCAAVIAQDQRPSFDVVSIRPAAPLPASFMPGSPGSPRVCPLTGCGGPGTSEPGRITFTSITVTTLIRAAYNLEPYQLEAPDGLNSARFDVVATLPPTSSREEANLMLQRLLADRFQLKVHRESRERPVYALVVAPGGAKLKASVPDPNAPKPRGTMWTRGLKQFEFDGFTMARFAAVLSHEVDRPVIDRTGLPEPYDVRLEFRERIPTRSWNRAGRRVRPNRRVSTCSPHSGNSSGSS